ncbi:site-specific DNA-methyltransferase [Candidatus Pacearchaeota archaeon]|nr:site-specific DNA-methyltransferase [Candidatus Pacearchaeota archaeon]
MVRKKHKQKTGKRKIYEKIEVKQYTYQNEKRANNPPVGLVTAETDHLNGQKKYQYDPHIDPQLQWAGKTEGQSFNVDTVSLHVHERIDPLTIIEKVKSREEKEQQTLFHYFELKENNPPIREAIEFYKHSQDWSNRLIAGDSLLIMNSLIEKEGMAGKVQMIYIDPPYGIKYGSNFQPFVNKRDVKDQKDEDLTQEPEMIKAFRDTWELGIHSYLTYLRGRLKLSYELLHESGSCFVQISDENLHHVREIMDEVFGMDNFITIIQFRTASTKPTKLLSGVCDFIIWYAKDKSQMKYRELFTERAEDFDDSDLVEYKNSFISYREAKEKKINFDRNKVFTTMPLVASTLQTRYKFSYNGKTYDPVNGWRVSENSMKQLAKLNRLFESGNQLRYKKYYSDFPYMKINATWTDLWAEQNKVYVVQTNTAVVNRCILMTTDPGDLVLDPTCGSGTTAYVAEQWGRRWITCDTSRVAITLAKQRLMTSLFEYYELAHPQEGVSSGFKYKIVPHITLGSIANNEPAQQETLYDQPLIDKNKKRVTGPFTFEAVPSQRVRSFDEIEAVKIKQEADNSVARSGETLRQNEWTDELLSSGIRGKGGQKLEFFRIEPLPATRWLHAEGETKTGEKVVVSFGPEYAPLEQRQVELAIEEAQKLVPKPKIIVFASFQFDPEAAKDIDELKWPGVNVIKAQMNTDLLTQDLKKKRSSNESFWLIGQPDIEIKKQGEKYIVQINGFDYYNTKTGEIESGDTSKIAMWELGEGEGWNKLAKNLKAFIDEDLIEKYSGNISLPFKAGKNNQIAVKIIDDRGIESLKIISLK